MVTTALLGRLFWTHSLLRDTTGVYSAGSTWADFGRHSAVISHLAVFDRMPLDLPVTSGVHLTYPFLVDFLSALYLRDGWSLHFSLFLPGVLLALAVCQLLLSFSLRLFGHVGAAVGGLTLFLLMGSAAGLRLAYVDWQHSGRSLPDFLSDLPRDYTVLSAENAVTRVASRSTTTIPSWIGAPVRSHTRSRATARAEVIARSAASTSLASVATSRDTVGSEATSPKTPDWARSTAISAAQSPQRDRHGLIENDLARIVDRPRPAPGPQPGRQLQLRTTPSHPGSRYQRRPTRVRHQRLTASNQMA